MSNFRDELNKELNSQDVKDAMKEIGDMFKDLDKEDVVMLTAGAVGVVTVYAGARVLVKGIKTIFTKKEKEAENEEKVEKVKGEVVDEKEAPKAEETKTETAEEEKK